MAISTAVVMVTGMVLLTCIVGLALFLKGKVKAAGQFKGASFSLEAEERRR
jgi:hypothetical protein